MDHRFWSPRLKPSLGYSTWRRQYDGVTTLRLYTWCSNLTFESGLLAGGKGLKTVSSATRIRIPATGEFTCGTPPSETEDRSRWSTWWPVQARSFIASVSSLDHFGGVRTLGYQKKKTYVWFFFTNFFLIKSLLTFKNNSRL